MRRLITVFLIAVACDIALAQRQGSLQIPSITTVAEGVVWRESANKDENGNSLPPWKEVRVTNVFGFKRAPRVGKKVTVIPLGVNVPLLELTILKIKKTSLCEDADLGFWWNVELKSVKQKEYFEITMPGRRDEVPFNAVIIYPAVTFARQLRRDQIRKATLPKGTFLNTVKAAIDLTKDGIPDVLVLEYCCLRPSEPAECDLTCGKTFKRVGNRWKLIDTSGPC